MARRTLLFASVPVALCAAVATRWVTVQAATESVQTVQGPKFEVDMLWPKPLPRHQLLGAVVGLAIDARDHIFVVHLTDSFVARTELGATVTPPIGECCSPAPNVLEFDADGNLVNHWGGPGTGYTWPSAAAGLGIDGKGNVWIGGAGGTDTQVLKFALDGKFVSSIGRSGGSATPAPAPAAPDTAYRGVSGAPAAAGGRGGRGRGRGGPSLPANSAGMDAFGGATGFAFDAAANEAFVADGSRNHRIAVVDLNTGAIKRVWGAYGKTPTDAPMATPNPTASQFGNPVSCVKLSVDGLLYVCDRANDRIQIFKKTGEFVKEIAIAPTTKGPGSVWDVTFSRDPQQQFLYVADGQNEKVHVLNRQTLAEITNFGDGGRQAGKWIALNGVATDSKGNLYTIETAEDGPNHGGGKRLQKFLYKGIGAVPKTQGVLWPARVP